MHHVSDCLMGLKPAKITNVAFIGIAMKRDNLGIVKIETDQPGLWFIAGSFAQCRINSKYLALQIKAIEQGIMPDQSAPKNQPSTP